MSRTRNVRDRQRRRWLLKTTELNQRNGVLPDGYDPRGVSHVLPWCVDAYVSRGPLVPPMSTRRFRQLERRSLS
ncbi:hypothetical protein GCM10009789_20040 [Kribbella sancticallisti]|uniref:Uncharacterized protein n=1 Tax=Kribbella sancticallisti TaxID=460087 RepID=A0ABN2CZ50_9ACTN